MNIELLTAMERRASISRLRAELADKWNTVAQWTIIRHYYCILTPMILSGGKPSPYGLGIEDRLTPIERELWNEIRNLGLPFYMQYPVGRRFVDFGDPVNCIAIEADGAAYHSAEKDAAKNRDLAAAGWRVFRVKGRDCFKDGALSDLYSLYGLTLNQPEEA